MQLEARSPSNSAELLKIIEENLGIIQEQIEIEANELKAENDIKENEAVGLTVKNEIPEFKPSELTAKQSKKERGSRLDQIKDRFDSFGKDAMSLLGFNNGQWSLAGFLRVGVLKKRKNANGAGQVLVLGNDIEAFPVVLTEKGFKRRIDSGNSGLGGFGAMLGGAGTSTAQYNEEFDRIIQEYPDIEEPQMKLTNTYELIQKVPEIKADKAKEPEPEDEKEPLRAENNIEDLVIPDVRTVQGNIKTYYNVEDFLEKINYEQANIDGMLLGIKQKWSPKPVTDPINRRRAMYRSKAIQYMMERGPDFMSNCFDIALVSTDLDLKRRRVPYIYPEDSYTMTTKAIAVRVASLEIPLPKTKTYETKFLTHTITRPASSVDWKFQSSLLVDLDEPLFILDMINDAIGQGVVRTAPGSYLNELTAEPRKRNYINTSVNNNTRIDLLVSHISLMRDYDSEVVKVTNHPELQWKLQPDQLPFWVFEDIKFLGNDGDIKFDRESANTGQMNLPFIFRRVYLMDMTGDERPSYANYGEGLNTRIPHVQPSYRTNAPDVKRGAYVNGTYDYDAIAS
jgi:hypothetical protein